MHIRLYEIKNLKVPNNEGKEIEKNHILSFGLQSTRSQNVCKDHYARIPFQCPRGTFFKPDEEAMKNF